MSSPPGDIYLPLNEFLYGSTRSGSRFKRPRAIQVSSADMLDQPSSPDSTLSQRTPNTYPPVDLMGYTRNLSELIDVLQVPQGLKMFKRAYRLNMLYKAKRYAELEANAERVVRQHKDVVDIKVAELKRAAGLNESDTTDNWNIFDSISQQYKEATDRQSLFRKIKNDANERLAQTGMQTDEVRSNDAIVSLRNDLVTALRSLGNFSSQSHVVSQAVNIVSSFLKDPTLLRQKLMNFMLVGGPGTGKTTIAEAMGKVFASAGIFVGDKLIEAGRAELVGQYEGQTVARTRSFLTNNLDAGVIFIDEAYAITPWHDGKPEGYGSEAATAMVEFMTRYPGLYCIIVAGYEKEMSRYFLPTNEGMSRRFPIKLRLADMEVNDMILVFKKKLLEYQGLEVPTGRPAELESDNYFTPDAWEYLFNLLAYATDRTITYEDDNDPTTKKTYMSVRRVVPRWPYLYQIFEFQAGSMAILADEAITVLYSTISFADVFNVQRRTDGIARPVIRSQDRSVMRNIVMQQIQKTALSDAELFLSQLEQIESLSDFV